MLRGGARARGVLGTLRSGHVGARALAVADSRALVRVLFLSSAVRLDVLSLLGTPRAFGEIAQHTHCTRHDRLLAWLAIGVELHELRQLDDRYVVRGRRARALAAGDPVLQAHYRSVLDYQTGPYQALDTLLHDEPGRGRRDLEEHATVIAQVSLAAAPFVIPFLRDIVDRVHPVHVLDVGCGTGVYTQALVEADPQVQVHAVDLVADVVASAEERLVGAGVAGRAEFLVGDIRSVIEQFATRFELITLLNNIYYFPRADRVALYRRLGAALSEDGELVVVTMTAPGSPAGAHLHFMLVCQTGAASLPGPSDIEDDLRAAGFATVESRGLVPTEPFIGVCARR